MNLPIIREKWNIGRKKGMKNLPIITEKRNIGRKKGMKNLPIIREKWNISRKKRCYEPTYKCENAEYRQEKEV